MRLMMTRMSRFRPISISIVCSDRLDDDVVDSDVVVDDIDDDDDDDSGVR